LRHARNDQSSAIRKAALIHETINVATIPHWDQPSSCIQPAAALSFVTPTYPGSIHYNTPDLAMIAIKDTSQIEQPANTQ